MFRHDRQQRSASFPDEASATRFKREVERFGAEHALDILGRRRGEHIAKEVPLLSEMTSHHIDHLTGVTPGTREEYRRVARRTFLPTLGEFPVDSISRDDVAKWVNWLAEKPTARGGLTKPKTIKNAHALLCSVLDTAVLNGHRDSNPAHKMRLPRVEKRDHYYLSVEEFAALLEALPARFRTLVWLTGATGLRWGEVTALRWRYVDLDDDPKLYVRLAWKKGPEGTRVLGVPKSARSRRTVGIPPALAADLREQRAQVQPGDSDLVFPGRGGRAIHHSHWNRDYFKPALAKVGIPTEVSFHALRHSFASWLLNAGHDMWDVSAAMGHESVNTTTSLYGHIAPDQYRRNAEAIGAILAAQTYRGNQVGLAIDNIVDGEVLPLLDDDGDD